MLCCLIVVKLFAKNAIGFNFYNFYNFSNFYNFFIL